MNVGREETPMRAGVTWRRALATTIAYSALLAAGALGVYSTLEYDPAHGRFAPQWVGLLFIYLCIMGVAAGVSASRLKLGETIISVGKVSYSAGYEAGLKAARAQTTAPTDTQEGHDQP